MTLLFYLFHFSVHSGGGPVKWRFLCCSRTWIRFPLLISKLCPLATLCSGRIGYFFLQIRQAHVRWRGRNFCLFHFLGIRAFFSFFFSSEATDAKRRRESVAFMLQRQSSGVTDRWEVVWGDIHLQRWWEESQRSDRFLHTCASFPQGVDPYSSRTDLHELNLRNEWEGCRWGKGPLRRSPCKEKFEAHFEEKALCCGLPGGTTLEIWALFKKSQCRGESDWTSLFVQWVMTAVVREQRGAVLLQFENFLDWINGQFPTWLTPYLPAHLNTVCRSRSRKQQDRLVLIFPSCGQSIYWALWLTFECAQSCDSIDWWLNYHRADRQLLWSFMISFKLVFSHRICLAWRYQGEK